MNGQNPGRMLALHLATDPALYQQFEAVLGAFIAADHAAASSLDGKVDEVHDHLLSKGPSRALTTKLRAQPH